MKAALRMIYPPQCLGCSAAVEQDGALCPQCWRDCAFVSGCACRRCGVPLPGSGDGDAALGDASMICDDCLRVERPWRHGRAALIYSGVGRQLVMSLKHGDRPDLAGPLGGWLSVAAAPLVRPGMVVAPVPLHPRRLLKRKFNQAALLSAQAARVHGLMHRPTLLYRRRSTAAQDRRSLTERYENLKDALGVTPRHRHEIEGRSVLLIDDVMASGATMTAAAEALLEAGAATVSIAVLARAVKE
ncbi:ComF family protein [Paracoccus aurantiacus]|uniref:ComF family protein n=2 Tax=Paracoccus aurantiacus TaxID=2599412 RepID=A0A5C6S934_9RHOB|nr:ComF family protein [Paracoccus aurantiacus]